MSAAKRKQAKRAVADLLELWPLIEADFQREYGLDTARCLDRMSWRRFLVLLRGLSTESSFKKMLTSENRVIQDEQEAERLMDAFFG